MHTHPQDQQLAAAMAACGESAIAEEAGLSLQLWRPIVQAIPASARVGHHLRALEELVDWYERLVSDPDCDEPAPQAGIDALVDELTTTFPHESSRMLALARWAIRVGEELARWRKCRTQGATGTVRVSTSRLELALLGARRFLDDEGAGGRAR